MISGLDRAVSNRVGDSIANMAQTAPAKIDENKRNPRNVAQTISPINGTQSTTVTVNLLQSLSQNGWIWYGPIEIFSSVSDFKFIWEHA